MIEPKLTPEQLAALKLNSGNHESPEEGHCLLEVVSMFAGEQFGDHPQCVDPVLAELGRVWNDGMRSDEERDQLKRYIPLLPGTNKGGALSLQRSWMALDWCIRTHLPAWLDLTPALAEHAAKLRALAPITGQPDLDRAIPTLEQAQRAGAASGAAAGAAAGAASGAAAGAAARAAAGAAAGAAAQKAGDSYQDQYAAARKVMDEALAPTTEKLQASAHDLYLSMINAELREMTALPHTH